jgi:hypothetical protein
VKTSLNLVTTKAVIIDLDLLFCLTTQFVSIVELKEASNLLRTFSLSGIFNQILSLHSLSLDAMTDTYNSFRTQTIISGDSAKAFSLYGCEQTT